MFRLKRFLAFVLHNFTANFTHIELVGSMVVARLCSMRLEFRVLVPPSAPFVDENNDTLPGQT